MNLPAANKQAVEVQISECKQILDEERAAAAVVDAPPPTDQAPAAGSAASDAGGSSGAASSSPSTPTDGGSLRPRWQDPVGLAFVGVGVVGLVAGTAFLVAGSSAQSEADDATSYDAYLAASDRAESDGRIGVIGLVAGGAFITAGVVWYMTRTPASPDHVVTGWVAPGSGGLAVSGRF
jgi:hypothetical protein